MALNKLKKLLIETNMIVDDGVNEVDVSDELQPSISDTPVTVFDADHLKQIGFTDSDCEAVAVLEHALQTGHHPQEPYQPIGKPYMIDFAKVAHLYFEYLNQQVSGKADERCPSVGSIKRGILELVDILQGKGELPKRQPSEDVQPKRIATAPNIQEPDQQEKELDELINKFSDVRRHSIEGTRKKGVPMKALLHAAALFLSDDMDDWTAANDTIYSFTSPFGLKQLQYPRKGN